LARETIESGISLSEKSVCFTTCFAVFENGYFFANLMERFVLATFMLSVGMPTEQVINLYSYTPNFQSMQKSLRQKPVKKSQWLKCLPKQPILFPP